MTENSNAIVEQQPQRSRPPAIQAGATISAFVPSTMDDAFRIANALAASGMTPKAYGNDVNKCFVGIMAGAELGLAPFQALQSIAVIGNNPAVWGDGALALIQASGLLEDIEETDDGHTATCKLVRKGKATPIIRDFSMDDAKKAGLVGKAGPWTQYPKRMRQMRARSWAMRDGFADVLKGLHIAEEVRDRPDLMEANPERPQRISSAMLAQQAGKTVQQIAHDPEPEPEAVQDAEIEEVTEPQHEDEAPGQLSPEAAQTLADIDGPLEPDQADQADDGVETEKPAYEVKADEIITKIDRCTTIIDLRELRKTQDVHIEAMPEETAGRVKRAFAAMGKALGAKEA